MTAARPGSRARASLDSARVSRVSEPQDPAFQRLNASIGFDRRLWPYDIQQSRAHATMLAAAGIIGEDDRDALLAGLDAVAAELDAGRFPFAPDDEDIHMAIERRLTELAGPVGGRLHTARSRNDQVATDVAMFTRDAARGMGSGARFRRERLAEAASDELIAATDIADLLVKKGVPFREAHGVVAGLVRVAVDSGRPLSGLTAAELRELSEHLDHAEVAAVLAQQSWLESKVSVGGTALARVREQLEAAHRELDGA